MVLETVAVRFVGANGVLSAKVFFGNINVEINKQSTRVINLKLYFFINLPPQKMVP
ncbi:hypothetical protein UF75_1455 [Desulfosporosinus sp. I2]|nr:hypothetical protein UF75_1455 [Desulfosporosinus sp. I2]